MYLKDINDKDTLYVLQFCSCKNCGLIPKFTSELKVNGVINSVSFTENKGWTFIVDTESKKMEHCYCPVCTRKMKLLQLKSKL